MKILVTGAAGFIGFHLCKSLLEKGIEIIGLDNINDYYDPDLKFARLNELGINLNAEKWYLEILSEKYLKFKFIRMNLEDRKNLFELFDKEKFDKVCNLAAQAGVRYCLDNPYTYISSNIQGFINILESCRNSRIKHLVYASSSSVYGNSKKIPFSTSDNVDYPISLYAATKKSNELMAHSYSHLFGFPTTGLSFFTVYGPWGRPYMAYFLFTEAILKGDPIKIFNNGELSRDFTYVIDIINGLNKVLFGPPSSSLPTQENSSAPFKIYNIGNGNPTNLLHFISIIEEVLGKKAKKEFLPMQAGDVNTTFANIDNLVKDFGYRPNTKLFEGIQSFIGIKSFIY